MLKLIRLCTLIFTCLTLGPLLAHLFELPNKIKLDGTSYLIVQSIYRGWDVLGIFEIGTIILTIIWLLMVRRFPKQFYLCLSALACFIISIGLFFIFTYPANTATQNWTVLTSNWVQLKMQWEYSHAARACLELIGFVLLLFSALTRRKRTY